MTDLDALIAQIDAAEDMVAVADAEIARCRSDLEFLGWTLPVFHTRWSTRGHTAGYCAYPCHAHADYELRFNAYLARQEGERFRETAAHEYAHAAIHTRYGRSVAAHGYEWRQLMQIFGYAGDRCHNYQTLSAASMKRRGL